MSFEHGSSETLAARSAESNLESLSEDLVATPAGRQDNSDSAILLSCFRGSRLIGSVCFPATRTMGLYVTTFLPNTSRKALDEAMAQRSNGEQSLNEDVENMRARLQQAEVAAAAAEDRAAADQADLRRQCAQELWRRRPCRGRLWEI